jgi:hypothetical protein
MLITEDCDVVVLCEKEEGAEVFRSVVINDDVTSEIAHRTPPSRPPLCGHKYQATSQRYPEQSSRNLTFPSLSTYPPITL